MRRHKRSDGKVAEPESPRWARIGARALICTAILVIASGCTTPYEGRYDFYEGWRKAEVKRIEPFEKLAPYQIPRCKTARSSQATEGSTWAVVRYRAGRRSREVAVQVTPSEAYKVRELVYVNVSECGRQIQRRATAG